MTTHDQEKPKDESILAPETVDDLEPDADDTDDVRGGCGGTHGVIAAQCCGTHGT